MAGIVSEKCNDLSKQIWNLCICKNIWISTVHIPGKQNTIADFLSRSLKENTKGQLSPAIFKKIIRTFDFEPAIHLFASYLNFQVENYISWLPDPKASIIDAFRIVSTNKKIHAFSLNGPTLNAVVVDPILVPFDATNAGRLQLPLQLPINLKSLFWHGKNKRYTHYNQK